MKTTLTTNLPMEKGDLLMITELDTRWWKRLWCWAMFRSPPYKQTVREVAKVIDDNTVELK